MGQHKYNPTAIAAKNGELPPKPKKMSKRQREAILMTRIMNMHPFNSLYPILRESMPNCKERYTKGGYYR